MEADDVLRLILCYHRPEVVALGLAKLIDRVVSEKYANTPLQALETLRHLKKYIEEMIRSLSSS